MYPNNYIQFGLSPYKYEGGKPHYHYHICFCYYWHNKLRRQFVCAVVRVIESNYPMLGKWLCSKRNPSGIHKAISEVRQSWNVGVLHINCSRSTTSFKRTSQLRMREKKYLVHAEADSVQNHSACCSRSLVQHQSRGAAWISTVR